MRGLPRFMVVGLAMGLLLAAASAQEPKTSTYVVIPMKGAIGLDFTAARIKTLLDEAVKMKVNVVVLEMDTPGGMVYDTEKIVDLLIDFKDIRVMAFVHSALSAGATIALACPEIYMTEGAAIGAGTPFKVSARGLPATVAEKVKSAWRAVCRKAAEHGGHPSAFADAMVDSDFALTMRKEGEQIVIEKDGKGEVLKAKGQVLNLTARKAVACGLAKGIVADLKVLGEQLAMPDWQERRTGPDAATEGPKK